MGEFATKFRDVWRNLEPRGQITIIGAGVAVAITFFFLFSYASKPSYSTLATALDPADAGEITKTLDGAGIGYSLRNGGTEIAVQKGAESRAQVALAEKGLPKGGHVGFELFDKKN